MYLLLQQDLLAEKRSRSTKTKQRPNSADEGLSDARVRPVVCRQDAEADTSPADSSRMYFEQQREEVAAQKNELSAQVCEVYGYCCE